MAEPPPTTIAAPAERTPRLLAPPPREPVAPGPRPTISVIMPYYRGADTVADAVRSALEQTLPPHEVVICDDGSPDDLAAALGPLRERVTIVRKENGGPTTAMNEAARHASGEYVLQLDQDDLFMPRRVEAIADALAARPDLDVVATDAIIELDGEPVVRYSAATPFEIGDQRRMILRHCYFAWPAIRRTRLLDAGGFDDRWFHAYDWACFIELLLDGALVGMVDEPLYRWRLTAGSITADGATNSVEEVRLLEAVLEAHALPPEERAIVERTIGETRRRGLLLAAKAAIADRQPDARSRALAVVREGGFAVPTRLKAAIAVASPRLARRLGGDRVDASAVVRRFGADPGAG